MDETSIETACTANHRRHHRKRHLSSNNTGPPTLPEQEPADVSSDEPLPPPTWVRPTRCRQNTKEGLPPPSTVRPEHDSSQTTSDDNGVVPHPLRHHHRRRRINDSASASHPVNPKYDQLSHKNTMHLLAQWMLRAEALAHAHDRTRGFYRATNLFLNTASITASATATAMSVFSEDKQQWYNYSIAAINSLSTVCMGIVAVIAPNTLESAHNLTSTAYTKVARDISVQMSLAGSRETLYTSMCECLRHIQSDIDYIEAVAPPLPNFICSRFDIPTPPRPHSFSVSGSFLTDPSANEARRTP